MDQTKYENALSGAWDSLCSGEAPSGCRDIVRWHWDHRIAGSSRSKDEESVLLNAVFSLYYLEDNICPVGILPLPHEFLLRSDKTAINVKKVFLHIYRRIVETYPDDRKLVSNVMKLIMSENQYEGRKEELKNMFPYKEREHFFRELVSRDYRIK